MIDNNRYYNRNYLTVNWYNCNGYLCEALLVEKGPGITESVHEYANWLQRSYQGYAPYAGCKIEITEYPDNGYKATAYL